MKSLDDLMKDFDGDTTKITICDRNKLKVFLGGTCNESTWRDKLISELKINYFNPIVDNWTEECIREEERQKLICRYHLYVITPKMKGTYSIAEVVDDSNKIPSRTIFCVLNIDDGKKFDKGQLKSLNQVGKLVQSNGVLYCKSLKEVSDYLNNMINDPSDKYLNDIYEAGKHLSNL